MDKNTNMGTGGVMDSVKFGLGFITRIDHEMLGMIGIFGLLALIAGYLGALYPMDMAGSGKEMTGFNPFGVLLLVFAHLPVYVWAVRKVLVNEAGLGFFNYFLQPRLWRLMGASIMVALMITVPFITLFVVAVGSAVVGGGGLAAIAQLGAGMLAFVIVSVGAIVFFLLRFAFLAQHVLMHDKIDIMGAFHVTKGHVLKILGVAVISGVVAALATLIFMAVVGFSFDALMGMGLVNETVGQALVSGIMSIVNIYFGLMSVAALTNLYKSVTARH